MSGGGVGPYKRSPFEGSASGERSFKLNQAADDSGDYIIDTSGDEKSPFNYIPRVDQSETTINAAGINSSYSKESLVGRKGRNVTEASAGGMKNKGGPKNKMFQNRNMKGSMAL